MSSKAKILRNITFTGSFIVSTLALAVGPGESISPDDTALVLKEFDRLHIEAPVAVDLAVMNVRVFGPDNELLLSKRTMGESVEFLVKGLPDGKYRYEIDSSFGDIDLNTNIKREDGETTLLRKFGSFKIVNGQLLEDHIPDQVNDASLTDKLIEKAVHLAGLTLDLIVPSANAAGLVSEASLPYIYFDDTQDEDCTPGADWWFLGDGGISDADTANYFSLRTEPEDLGSGCGAPSFEVIRIDSDGTTNIENSLAVDADGDIHWADGRMNFDKGTSKLSIGTTAVYDAITVADDFPGIRLLDTFWNYYAGLENEGLDVYIFGRSNQRIAEFATDAPANSITVLSNGDTGIGTSSPVASLEVRRLDTAAIEVNNTTAVSATRNMFSLVNKGLTKFIINNLDGAEWAFANKGTSFRISRQGSGKVEMEVFNNGNVTIQGVMTQLSDVNEKTNIVAIDQRSVLERVTDMPISQWQYKDALGENHIGPTAQDFYAAFGLGKTDTGLTSIDTSGVALVAIKALAEENMALREQVQSQQARLDALENHQVEMQAMMTTLIEAQQASPVLTKTVMN